MLTLSRQTERAAADHEADSEAALRWLGLIENLDGAEVSARIDDALLTLAPMRARHAILEDQRRLVVLAIFLTYADTRGLTPAELASLADAPAWLAPRSALLRDLDSFWRPVPAGHSSARRPPCRTGPSPRFARRASAFFRLFHTVESDDLAPVLGAPPLAQ